ncbi:DMT family transporter [Oceanobacillus senegalensis]|uniref:DMT family transporter n=1 Tax=Oceanobacillus senegalensis TaxID=1936063 RepID=UPI000A30CC65|nr:DMT family transporter [Oceanobacillus senegalensis]
MGKSLIYGQLMLVMVMWGFNVIAIKVIVGEFAAVTITSFRIFLAATVVVLILGLKKQIRLPKKKELLYISLISITGVLGHHFFLSVGLTQTTASSSGLILGLVPLFTSILASILLKERLSIMRMVGIFFGLFGVSLVILVGNGASFTFNLGDIYIFLAVLTQAISFIYIKKATETMGARLVTGYTLMLGSFLLFLLSMIMEPNGLSSLKDGTALGWSVFLGSAILATAVGQFLYNHAIQYIGPGKSSIFMNLTPFFALIGSFLFLGEKITIAHFLGFVFIVTGVILGSGIADRIRYRRMVKEHG